MAAATTRTRNANSKVITLTKERETKGTWRYQEEGDNPTLRTLYLPKRVVTELGDPAMIEVTIAAK